MGVVTAVSMRSRAVGMAAMQASNCGFSSLSSMRSVSLPNWARSALPMRRSWVARSISRATKVTAPPWLSTSERTRSGKPAATEGSGAKVKISDRPPMAASLKTRIQNSSRNATNCGDPKGKTAITESTIR